MFLRKNFLILHPDSYGGHHSSGNPLHIQNTMTQQDIIGTHPRYYLLSYIKVNSSCMLGSPPSPPQVSVPSPHFHTSPYSLLFLLPIQTGCHQKCVLCRNRHIITAYLMYLYLIIILNPQKNHRQRSFIMKLPNILIKIFSISRQVCGERRMERMGDVKT